MSDRDRRRADRAIPRPFRPGPPGFQNRKIYSRSPVWAGDSLRLDAVLEAVKLPARVTGLDTGLADVDGDNLTHC